MKIIAVSMFLGLMSFSALATDPPVTLVLTSSTGAVITVSDMSQKECDAAAVLLNKPRHVATYTGSSSGNLVIMGSIDTYPYASRTPELSDVKCMVKQ